MFQLALRAGNEKETDEAADTVGCCSLRVEHIKLHEEHGDKELVYSQIFSRDFFKYKKNIQYSEVNLFEYSFPQYQIYIRDKFDVVFILL